MNKKHCDDFYNLTISYMEEKKYNCNKNIIYYVTKYHNCKNNIDKLVIRNKLKKNLSNVEISIIVQLIMSLNNNNSIADKWNYHIEALRKAHNSLK